MDNFVPYLKKMKRTNELLNFFTTEDGIVAINTIPFSDKKCTVKSVANNGITIIDSLVENNNKSTNWKHYNDTPFVEFNFVLEGSLKQSQSGLYKDRHQNKGYFNLQFNPNSCEENQVGANGSFRNLGIHLSPERAVKLFEEYTPQLNHLPQKIRNNEPFILEYNKGFSLKMKYLFDSLWNRPADKGLGRLHFEAYNLELFALACEHFLKTDSTYHPLISKKDKEKLFFAQEILISKLNNPPSLRELSLQCGLNEFKLKRGFKSLFGFSVLAFVHHKRMEQAKVEIFSGEKNISEIAYDLGYAHPQHFHRAFKKHFGQTPKSLIK